MGKPARFFAGTKRAQALKTLTLAVAATSLLSACGPRTGDFGRPIPDPISFRALAETAGDTLAKAGDPEAWAAGGQALERGFIGAANRILGAPRPDVPDGLLTGVELELRQRLWHFQQDIPPLPATTPVARFNALTDAILIDTQLLPSLIELRALVHDKDRIRAAALPAFPAADKYERQRVIDVATSNAGRIAEICLNARRRAAGYRRQMERLVLEAPEPEAIRTERSLHHLDRLISEVCGMDGLGQVLASPRAGSAGGARSAATGAGRKPLVTK